MALISFITFTYAKCYYDTLRSSHVSDEWLYLVSFEFIFSGMLMLLMVGFCTFHYW